MRKKEMHIDNGKKHQGETTSMENKSSNEQLKEKY